jgi:RNA polymerase sigma-70 factor (ECF subfamily)
VLALKQSPQTEDAELIAAALEGSEAAFASLVGRYQDRVFRLLGRFTRDQAECEDLGQEVFLKVFRKLHTFQQDSAFFTWLYRIAVNTASDHLSRQGRRRLQLVEDDSMLDEARSDREGEEPERPVMAAELSEATQRVLAKLPEKYRTILVLREFEDLSYTDLAQVLELNMGTVESRLFRARQRFKEALIRMYPELVPQVRGGVR